MEPMYELVAKNFATHFSDTDYTDISLSECSRLCQQSPDYPCRAFFFGHTVLGKFCGLMHLTAAAVAKIPGGNFPVDGVNLYQPVKKVESKGRNFEISCGNTKCDFTNEFDNRLSSRQG